MQSNMMHRTPLSTHLAQRPLGILLCRCDRHGTWILNCEIAPVSRLGLGRFGSEFVRMANN